MEVFGREPINRFSARVPRGQLFLIPSRCKGCEICIHFCPQSVLRSSTTTNGKGYHLPEIVPGKEEACTNCDFCSLICPEFAIYSKEVAG